jgi:hypothetical protein
MGSREYTDRSLAISDHAVARFRERTGAHHLERDACRHLIGQAVRAARSREYPHYVVGQTVVRVTILGVEVFAVIGQDLTGWSRSGRAVITVLTEEQLDASWKARS